MKPPADSDSIELDCLRLFQLELEALRQSIDQIAVTWHKHQHRLHADTRAILGPHLEGLVAWRDGFLSDAICDHPDCHDVAARILSDHGEMRCFCLDHVEDVGRCDQCGEPLHHEAGVTLQGFRDGYLVNKSYHAACAPQESDEA